MSNGALALFFDQLYTNFVIVDHVFTADYSLKVELSATFL